MRPFDQATRPGRLGAALLVAALVAAVVAACGSVNQGGPSLSASAAVASPSGSTGPTGSGAAPSPTAWPGEAVLGIVGLGAGDGEIAKAIADFSEAVAAQDLLRMRGAAIGLENLITALNKQVDRITGYAPMAGLVDQYHAAFTPMLDGAQKLRVAIDAGDAAGIVAGTQRITDGMAVYGQIRAALSSWVEQATAQQRLLVK